MPLLPFSIYFGDFVWGLTQNRVLEILPLIELEDYQIGGDGADSLRGHSDHDLLMGMGGNDRLSGLQGRDILHGGFGNDWMWGGADGDSMHGCFGNDSMDGGSGNDYMHGGFGNDRMWGGSGNDTMAGCCGDDRMLGGTGNDWMHGGFGDDCLLGETGNDTLNGCFGDDTIKGGAGNDCLSGGYGQDVFVFDGGRDVIRDFELGGGCEDDCGCSEPTSSFVSTDPVNGDKTEVHIPDDFCFNAEYAETIIVDIDGIDDYDDLTATASQQGDNVVFDMGDGNRLTINGVELSQLDESMFVFV